MKRRLRPPRVPHRDGSLGFGGHDFVLGRRRRARRGERAVGVDKYRRRSASDVCTRVPHAGGAVQRRRQHPRAVSEELHADGRLSMRAELSDRLLAANVPQLDGGVVQAGDEGAAGVVERMQRRVHVDLAGGALAEAPQPHAAVGAAAEHEALVAHQRDRAHARRVAAPRAHHLGALWPAEIADLDARVPAAGDEDVVLPPQAADAVVVAVDLARHAEDAVGPRAERRRNFWRRRGGRRCGRRGGRRRRCGRRGGRGEPRWPRPAGRRRRPPPLAVAVAPRPRAPPPPPRPPPRAHRPGRRATRRGGRAGRRRSAAPPERRPPPSSRRKRSVRARRQPRAPRAAATRQRRGPPRVAASS